MIRSRLFMACFIHLYGSKSRQKLSFEMRMTEWLDDIQDYGSIQYYYIYTYDDVGRLVSDSFEGIVNIYTLPES